MSKEIKEKKDRAITIAIIGLVGTLVAALLGSPVLVELIKNRQGTETPPISEETKVFAEQILIFREDFDSDNVSGFAYDGGEWAISKDKSNQVLEVDTTSIAPGEVATAIFGPSDFSDGIVEFHFRVNQFATESTTNINFRYTNQSTYSLAFLQNYAIMGYRNAKNDWGLEQFSDETSRTFLFEKDVWYLVRLEARGAQFTAFIDNNRLFSASDNRLQKGELNFTVNPGYQAMFEVARVWELK